MPAQRIFRGLLLGFFQGLTSCRLPRRPMHRQVVVLLRANQKHLEAAV